MSARPLLTIGTRGSPLALIQANVVRDALIAAHPDLAAPGAVGIAAITTTGDRVRDRALAEIGGKGLFTREIEESLESGAIHMAVHSMKDVPTWLPDGLVIAAMLEREDPRDALITRRDPRGTQSGRDPRGTQSARDGAAAIADLPRGAVIGSASVRRQAQLLARRPDFKVVLFRGNVDTRLRKLREGEVDATLLALAGLKRLGRDREIAHTPLDPSVMLPSAAQGVIGVECREGDERVRDLLAAIDHAPTATAVAAERALLAVLDGSCRTPIGALAEIDGELWLRGLVARADGSETHVTERRGAPADAAALGADAGRELKAAAGPGFFES